MLTVLETEEFIRRASKIMSDEERTDLISFLAFNPVAGDEIVGSGGIRKLRLATRGRGKSGSARIIYFFYSEIAPLYLLTCFEKSTKSDLSDAEVNSYAKVAAAIKAHYRRRMT